MFNNILIRLSIPRHSQNEMTISSNFLSFFRYLLKLLSIGLTVELLSSPKGYEFDKRPCVSLEYSLLSVNIKGTLLPPFANSTKFPIRLP